MFRSFTLPLFVAGLLALSCQLQAQEGAASGGTLKIGDQEFKLTHAVAFESLQSGEKQLNILLGIKPIDRAKLKASLEKDGTDDGYFAFDPQVKVKFDAKGKASYTFAYADGTSINVAGSERLTGEAAVKDGNVTGHARLVIDPESDAKFKSQFEIKFNEPLLAAKLPAGKPDDEPEPDEPIPPKTAKTKGKKTKTNDDDVPHTIEQAEALAKRLLGEALGDDEDAPKGKKTKPAATLNVKDLPLPEGASDVAYKKLVEQMTFKTANDVETTAEAFATGLKKQGWERSGADLIGGTSAILRRKMGKAELTIFVKPSGEGSAVTMMTSGLSWDEK